MDIHSIYRENGMRGLKSSPDRVEWVPLREEREITPHVCLSVVSQHRDPNYSLCRVHYGLIASRPDHTPQKGVVRSLNI